MRCGRMRRRDQPVEAVSLRLTPPVVRMDLWSDEGIARLLLEAGADPNIREPACLRTPLMFAATTENARLVGLLIVHAVPR